MIKIEISDHNKKALKLLLLGMVLWPTPLPGLVLLVVPGVLLLDFKLKRKFDFYFWNTKTGSYIHKKIDAALRILHKELPKLEQYYLTKEKKFDNKVGRWLFPRILKLIRSSDKEFMMYIGMFERLKTST